MLVANVRSHTSHGQVRLLARHSVSEAQVYFPEYESESATAGPVWMSRWTVLESHQFDPEGAAAAECYTPLCEQALKRTDARVLACWAADVAVMSAPKRPDLPALSDLISMMTPVTVVLPSAASGPGRTI